MSEHQCPRCGFESSRDRWHERHPVAAAIFGLPAFLTVVGATIAHPWFAVPVLVAVCALLVNDAMRRRAAIAARADWDYRQQMAASIPLARPPLPSGGQFVPPPGPAFVRPRNPAPWHVVTQMPTQVFHGPPDDRRTR